MPVSVNGGISAGSSDRLIPQSPTMTAWRTFSPAECIAMGVATNLEELVTMLAPSYGASGESQEGFGSAAHAIGRALRILVKPNSSQTVVDVSMSLVLRHALQGDAAARVLVVFALGRVSAPSQLLQAWRDWRLEPRERSAGASRSGLSHALQ